MSESAKENSPVEAVPLLVEEANIAKLREQAICPHGNGNGHGDQGAGRYCDQCGLWWPRGINPLVQAVNALILAVEQSSHVEIERREEGYRVSERQALHKLSRILSEWQHIFDDAEASQGSPQQEKRDYVDWGSGELLAMMALDAYLPDEGSTKSTSVVYRIHQLGRRAEQAEQEIARLHTCERILRESADMVLGERNAVITREQAALRRLSDVLSGGIASTWEEVFHAAEAALSQQGSKTQSQSRSDPASAPAGGDL